MVELGTSRQRIEDLARENGRQSAELERAASIAVKLSDDLEVARAQISMMEARTAPESVEPTPGPPGNRWRALAPWLFVAALLAIVVAGVAWPR